MAGAANAYGAALQRDPAHLGALGNRAVARLRLGHDTAAALDCTTALSLLPRPPVDPAPALPPVDLALLRKQADAAAALAAEMSTKGKGAPGPAAPSAEASEVRSDRRATIAAAETADAAAALIGSAGVSERPELSSATPLGPRRALQRCLARRAAALLHMGQFARAAADFRAAAECARRDPGAGASGPSPASVAAALEEEAASADRLLEAETLKRNGDAQLLAKDPAAALPHYAASLAVQPGFVPALVNRAGAHASLKDLAACERDASAALEALGIGEAETSVAAAVQAWAAAGEMPAFVPAWGSVRLSAWIKTACLRRAAARMRMGRPKDGEPPCASRPRLLSVFSPERGAALVATQARGAASAPRQPLVVRQQNPLPTCFTCPPPHFALRVASRSVEGLSKGRGAGPAQRSHHEGHAAGNGCRACGHRRRARVHSRGRNGVRSGNGVSSAACVLRKRPAPATTVSRFLGTRASHNSDLHSRRPFSQTPHRRSTTQRPPLQRERAGLTTCGCQAAAAKARFP